MCDKLDLLSVLFTLYLLYILHYLIIFILYQFNNKKENNMPVNLTIGDTEFFKGITKIKYEGKDSKNPLAFKYYDPDKEVAGKRMEDHLRFAVAYWHSFGANGADPFGVDTKNYPWLKNGCSF